MVRQPRRKGRCQSCRTMQTLTVAGKLINHPPRVPIPCPGSGRDPIDPATDDTPDWRDTQTVWDANARLGSMADRVRQYGHVSGHDRASVDRIRRVRDDARAGTNRLPKGAPK